VFSGQTINQKEAEKMPRFEDEVATGPGSLEEELQMRELKI
jgi:hypothetical protein